MTPTDNVIEWDDSFVAKRDLRGIISSLHTPFLDDDTVDEDSLALLVDHCADSGCVGVLVSAVAGEVTALNEAERKRILAVVSAQAAARLHLVVGISAATVEESVALATQAADFVVPMVMWQPPPGLNETQLVDALKRIAGAGGFQIMLQDLDWSGPGLAPELIVRLTEAVPELTAVKVETVPAGPKYTAVAELSGGRLHLSGGWAVMQMLDGLARGLDAFIPSGLLPIHSQIFAAWANGDHDRARSLFERILPVLTFSNQHIDVSGRFWKAVRVRQGIFRTANCRLPAPLDTIQQAEADRLGNRAIALEAEYLSA